MTVAGAPLEAPGRCCCRRLGCACYRPQGMASTTSTAASGAHCHAGVPAATLLVELPGLEASSVACVRTSLNTGRVDGCSDRCVLLRTQEARFDSASYWSAIRLTRVRLSVVCVCRSRERGLNSRGVRRWARARRRFSRSVAHRDGGEQCGARSVRARLAGWPRAELCQRYQETTTNKRSICSVCLIGGRWTVCSLLLVGSE